MLPLARPEIKPGQRDIAPCHISACCRHIPCNKAEHKALENPSPSAHWKERGIDDAMHLLARLLACMIGSCGTAELLGYFLHRLLHTGWIGFLSKSHMDHHMRLYGPLQRQRAPVYHDATDDRLSLGNVGLEWLGPGALLIGAMWLALRLLRVSWPYQLLFIGTVLAWSFIVFSYLHDRLHIENFWMEKNRLARRWFLGARRLHDIHHRTLNDKGMMDRNFGIGFYVFDRLFGTIARQQAPFNREGFEAAKERFLR